jgi:hypothetical protein
VVAKSRQTYIGNRLIAIRVEMKRLQAQLENNLETQQANLQQSSKSPEKTEDMLAQLRK